MKALSNALWGVQHAAWAIAGCTLLAAAATFADASLSIVDLARYFRFYLTAGLIAGLTLGLGRPLLRSVFGRGLVGFLVALPVFFAALFQPPFGAPLPLDATSVKIWVALSAFVGPFGAAYVTLRNRRQANVASRRDA